MLPSSVARFNERAGLQIVPLTLPSVHIAASIVTVKNRTLNPAAELFVKCLNDIIRPLAMRTQVNVITGELKGTHGKL